MERCRVRKDDSHTMEKFLVFLSIMVYAALDYRHMVGLYDINDHNAAESARQFRLLYPGHGSADHNTVLRAVHRLETTGNLMPQRNEPKFRDRDEWTEIVLDHFANDPGTSTRRAEVALGISATSIGTILRENGFHPYHYTKVQELLEADYPLRQRFCEQLADLAELDPSYLRRISWTDECTFMQGGFFNVHNTHYYSEENPFLTWDTSIQRRFSVNVWAGLLDDEVIGPVFLPPRLDGQTYLQFLQNDLPPLLYPDGEDVEDIPLAHRNIISQQDGAPAHFFRAVRDHLDFAFPTRWIGRGGPTLWPPRSPDLTTLEFYLWGVIKEEVYKVKIRDEEHLIQRIRAAFANLDRAHVRRATRSVLRRARQCISRQGQQFQPFPRHYRL